MARKTSTEPEGIEQEYFFPEYGKVVTATSQEEALKLLEAEAEPASPIIEGTPND